MPLWNAKAGFFPKDRFTYAAAHNVYTCPGEQTFSFVRRIKPQRVLIYRAPAAICAGCALRSQCTDGKSGRAVARSYDEAYLDRVRAYQQTEAYKRALRKRSMWVEPLFGEAKEWHGLRRFRLRRLWRVNAETLLTAAGQNLKRLLSRAGWGRRPFPSGAAGVVLGPNQPLLGR